jgi:hypothetical protein
LFRPVSEEEMDKNIGSEGAWPSDFWNAGDQVLPSLRAEHKTPLWLSRGEALVLVLLLSFGLWAAIWGVVALLLTVGGRW